MTIKAKLILLAAASLVAILVTSVISNVGNRLLSEVAEESSAFAQFRSLSDYDAQVSTLHLQYTLALQHNPANTDVLKLHNHEVSMHFDLYDKAKQALLSRRTTAQQHHKHSVFSAQTQQLYDKMERFLEIAQSGIAKMKQNDFLGANDVLIKQLNAAAKAVGEASIALKEEILHESQGAETKAKSVKDTVDVLLLVSGIIAFMIIAVLAWLVIRAISHSVKQTTDGLALITSTMNFSASIPVAADEMGAVANSVNQLIKQINQALTEANTCVSALSKGNVNAQMTGHFVGDLERLKQGINGSIANISEVMTFLSDVMLQMKHGNFHFEAHLQAEGVYQQMFNNTRDALHQVDAVLDSINKVMSQMAIGDFNGRVTVEAAGRLLMIKQNMNHSMNAIAHAISAVSDVMLGQAQGDLSKSLTTGEFKGQLHDLTNAINYSTQRMKDSVVQAIAASNVVSQASAQVSQGSADLSGRVQQQAAALEETSATMNEMTVAVQTNTANAQRVAELAHQVQHQAGAGVNVMQETITAMQSIRDSSSKIADIVTLIDDIAFQTNLLALNAAVEAARAGEHGRGFAVVAGEVRSLAQKSAAAAKDIKDLINDSVMRIEVGTQLADKSGAMLSGITGSIEQVADMIEQIAHASGEQAAGITQVHLAMSNIDRTTQENSALVEETTSAAQSLREEAEQLKETMAFFNIGKG